VPRKAQQHPQAGITPAQRRLVQAARRQLNLDAGAYRALLMRVAGVTSSTELDQGGLTRLILELERAGFNNTSRGKPFGERPGFATGAQIALIKKLWGEYVGEAGSETGLSTWLRRTCHCDHLRFLGVDEARGAIEGLKVMVARRRGGFAA
jgi:hypothetical protein